MLYFSFILCLIKIFDFNQIFSSSISHTTYVTQKHKQLFDHNHKFLYSFVILFSNSTPSTSFNNKIHLNNTLVKLMIILLYYYYYTTTCAKESINSISSLRNHYDSLISNHFLNTDSDYTLGLSNSSTNPFCYSTHC